jgi:hypothetical protein
MLRPSHGIVAVSGRRFKARPLTLIPWGGNIGPQKTTEASPGSAAWSTSIGSSMTASLEWVLRRRASLHDRTPSPGVTGPAAAGPRGWIVRTDPKQLVPPAV